MVADGHPDANQMLTGLSETQRSQALQRWRILRLHVEDAVPLARVAADAGVPERTAQRWLARYRAGGLADLARPARADRDRRRFPADLIALIAASFGASTVCQPGHRAGSRRLAYWEGRPRRAGRSRQDHVPTDRVGACTGYERFRHWRHTC
jgi:hypothetical protein